LLPRIAYLTVRSSQSNDPKIQNSKTDIPRITNLFSYIKREMREKREKKERKKRSDRRNKN
jgi:hypothetical protein